jgi:hypothetical protein
MPHFTKPDEGSWTEHFKIDTTPVSYEDSISPEHYELERDAIFRKTWLNVGRVERLPQHVPAPRQQARVERLPA